MSDTKLNQAILRVAKQNPEFRKALQAELGKTAKELTEAEVNFLQDVKDGQRRALARKGRMARRMEKDKYIEKLSDFNVEWWKLTKKGEAALKKTYSWEKKASLLQAELHKQADDEYRSINLLGSNIQNARFHLNQLDKIVGKTPSDWYGRYLHQKLYDFGKNWTEFKEIMEKAKANFDKGYQAMAAVEAQFKRQKNRIKRYKARMARFADEVARSTPPGVNAQHKLSPNGWTFDVSYTTDNNKRGSFTVEYDYNDYEGTKYNTVSVFPKGQRWFDVKLEQKNPAKTLWDELYNRGLL
jgi:hypothetical protein